MYPAISTTAGAPPLSVVEAKEGGIPVSGSTDALPMTERRTAFPGMKDEEALVLSTIYRSITSIGHMDTEPRSRTTSPADRSQTRAAIPTARTDTGPGTEGLPIFRSVKEARMMAHLVVEVSEEGGVDDLLAIHALVGIELWFYLSRNLRPAMHLSGIVGSEFSFPAS